MRIELRISGGVTGMRRPPLVVDTDALPDTDARALEALAGRLDPAAAIPPPPGPDRLQLDLTIDGRRLTRHEGALTTEERELVARVRRLGRAG